jgi:hypothetical protein
MKLIHRYSLFVAWIHMRIVDFCAFWSVNKRSVNWGFLGLLTVLALDGLALAWLVFNILRG